MTADEFKEIIIGEIKESYASNLSHLNRHATQYVQSLDNSDRSISLKYFGANEVLTRMLRFVENMPIEVNEEGEK